MRARHTRKFDCDNWAGFAIKDTMTNLVSFPGKADGPHIEGVFQCGACGHEWREVQPVGDADHLECPNCKRFWGAAKHAVVPSKAVWTCNCGNSLFWLTPDGAMCRKCGIITSDWAE